MKNLFLLSLIVTCQLGFSQVFTEHLISDNTDGAVSVYVVDIDNDGDNDVLGAVYEEHKIVCWYNSGDNLQFERITIEYGFGEAGCVHAADYNNDGLIDVVGAARSGNKIYVWYNTGDKDSWTRQVLHSSYFYAHEVYSVDIDGDDDIDILSASSSLNEITLWENNGGDPVDWNEITIANDFGMAKSVCAADIDNDGNLDIVGAALIDNKISWWKKEGETWNKNIISTNFYGVHRVNTVDVDKDGFVDVVSAAYLGNKIGWWKNNGDDPLTWQNNTVTLGFNDACIATASDMDNDGDIDIVGPHKKIMN